MVLFQSQEVVYIFTYAYFFRVIFVFYKQNLFYKLTFIHIIFTRFSAVILSRWAITLSLNVLL